MIHLALFVRQLTRTQTRCLVYEIGRLHLQIAALACLLKEEGLQSALKACHLAYIDGKSGSRNFYA